jgi:Domain of unknown function (DUF4287)
MCAARPKKSQSIYAVHPGVIMAQKWISELKQKTGRSLDEWMALAKQEGPPDEKDLREWLKISHRLGTNSAWWIAARVERRHLTAAPSRRAVLGEEKIAPSAVMKRRCSWRRGSVPKACPCRTIVPLYRHHVFAQLKPTTNTRLDLGPFSRALQGKVEAPGGDRRLGEAGPHYAPDRVENGRSHRFRRREMAADCLRPGREIAGERFSRLRR